MSDLTLKRGFELLNDKKYEAVHTGAIELIKKNVFDPLPYFLLGIIASEHSNQIKALELFTKAKDADSDNIYYVTYYAKTLSALGRGNEARDCIDALDKIDVEDAFLLDMLGVIYSRSGFHELAIPLFQRAVTINSNQPNFFYNLGASAQFSGDFKTAKTAYEKTLALDPQFYRAWSSLISLSKQTEASNHLDRLEQLFEDASGDPEAQLQLGHAIAKTLEDLGRYPKSLGWLQKGKSQKRKELRYDREGGEALIKSAKATSNGPVSSENFQEFHSPIFIVGMPRTGTTLVDRILSSHSDVTSAGELNEFAELVKAIAQTGSNLVLDAETLDFARDMDCADIGRDYLKLTRDRARGGAFMVDKMPLNFFYAGLINRAFANVKIIALRRGAMDSCLSNYRQLLSTQFSFYNYTFDLEDTAFFYRQFDDLMTHWRTHLPSNRFMEIHYEDIVLDQENQTRRLLDFCELPWEDACMRFHENTAPVSTASSVQVRQPLHAGSIGRWKKYGDKLDGLKQALGDLAD